ncbi:serine hydrolase domain-containing protein [Enterococcus sp. LJL120]
MKHKRHHRIILGWFVLFLMLGVVWGASQFVKETPSNASVNETTAASSTTTSSTTSTVASSSSTTSSATDATVYANLTNGQTVVAGNEGTDYDQIVQKSGFYGSVLVVHNGQIKLSKGYGNADNAKQIPNSPTTLYNIGSTQKGMTGTLIMQAAEEGKLALSDKLSKYYPQIAGSDQVTLKMMLDMASGLQLTNSPKNLAKDSDALPFFTANAAIKNTVGKFDYQPINFNLLAGILEKVYQQNYYTIFDNYYGTKAGITNYSFYQNIANNPNVAVPYSNNDGTTPYGTVATESANDYIKELGTGNVFMSTGQLYRYYSLLLSGQLISAADVKTLQTPEEASGAPYASGLYNEKTYYASHGQELTYETYVALSPDGQTAVIIASNQDQDKTKIDRTLLTDLYKELTGVTLDF